MPAAGRRCDEQLARVGYDHPMIERRHQPRDPGRVRARFHYERRPGIAGAKRGQHFARVNDHFLGDDLAFRIGDTRVAAAIPEVQSSRGNVAKKSTAESEKTGRQRISPLLETGFHLLDGRESAGLHLANLLRRGAFPRRCLALQAQQVELNLLPLALRHPRESLLHLEEAHAGKMEGG